MFRHTETSGVIPHARPSLSEQALEPNAKYFLGVETPTRIQPSALEQSEGHCETKDFFSGKLGLK
jgi:hypothetical protein